MLMNCQLPPFLDPLFLAMSYDFPGRGSRTQVRVVPFENDTTNPSVYGIEASGNQSSGNQLKYRAETPGCSAELVQ